MADLVTYRGWALVTGAASGLGSEFARQIAAQGVDCVLVGLDHEGLAQLAQALQTEHGIACRTLEVDLAQPDAIDRVTTATADIPIGILVNCAGMTHGGPFATRDPEKLDRLVKANSLAPVLLTRAFLPPMLERGAGAIIIVASLQAYIACPYESAYCASKAFLLHFGESLWGELRNTPVDCLTLCPAGMKTNLFKAAGYSDADCARMWRISSQPHHVAALALRKLGKQPVAAPAMTHLAALAVRLLPRRWGLYLVRSVSRQLVDHKAL